MIDDSYDTPASAVKKATGFPTIALFTALLIGLFLGLSPSSYAQPANFMRDEILVKMRPQLGVNALARALPGPGNIMKSLDGIRVQRIKLPRGMTLQQGLDAYRKLPGVEYAEPNHIMRLASTPNDASYSLQYGPHITKADLAWDIWSPHGTTIIAIIDTGVANTHPDLTNKILRDVNGIVGYNASVTDPMTGQLGARDNALDDYGHGTHVAGIAAAQSNNTTGVAGIAGWDGVAGHTDTSVKIMPVKVLTGGSGSDADVAGGIIWATDHGAKVINMSLGDTATSTTLEDACQYAWTHGVVVVAAAGNNSSNAPFYPASTKNVLSVAATDNTDTLAGFSNYGARVNVAAPGNGVYSTLPNYGGTAFGNDYGTLSGTSMACPHAAGEAALILSHNPNLSNKDVVFLITKYVDPYTPFSGRTISPVGGRINILMAIQQSTLAQTPDAPTGLSAVSGVGSATLTWNASLIANTYNVRRSLTAGGPYTTVATTPNTTYTNTGLTNGTRYYYVVTALNNTNESANSNETSVIPNAPSNSAVFVKFDATTSGNWKGVYGADGYNIYNYASSYPAYAQVVPTGNLTFVWAASTTEAVALQKPDNLNDRYAACWYNTTWTSTPNYYYIDVNMTDGLTHQVALYCLDYHNNNHSVDQVDIYDATSNALLDTQTVSSFTSGKYAVWNLKGHVKLRLWTPNGDYTQTSGLFFDPSGPPQAPPAPSGLTATGGNAQVSLNWNAVGNATSYNIKRSLTHNGTYATIKSGQTTNSYVDAGLTNGTPYYYVVSAVNAIGESANSAEATATPAAAANTATFVKFDTTTSGNWKGVYGADGYNLFNYATSYPAYAQVTPTGNSTYIWNSSTTETVALQKLGNATDRFAGCWYNPQWTSTPNYYYVDVNLTDGQPHQVALYCLDYHNANHSVDQVDIYDATTNVLLDTQTVSSFTNGTYAVWTLKGHVKLRLWTPNGDYTQTSGLFFDPSGPPQAPPAPSGLTAVGGNAQVSLNWNAVGSATSYNVKRSLTQGGAFTTIKTGQTTNSYVDTGLTNGTPYFYAVSAVNAIGESANSATASATPATSANSAVFVKMDATTSGNWKGVYGADGYNLFNYAVSYPAYAQVTATNNLSYVWSNSTTEAVALQKLGNATDRFAGCWYNPQWTSTPNYYYLDVNLTDGQPHQVALYCLDYHNANHSVDQIDIYDATTNVLLDTQTVSSFTSGKYAVWTLKGHVKLRVWTPNGDYTQTSGLFFN